MWSFGDLETVEDMLYKFTYSAPEFGVAALTPIAGVGLLLKSLEFLVL